jgi:hypothetical protein
VFRTAWPEQSGGVRNPRREAYLPPTPSGEGSARTGASSWAAPSPSSRPRAWCGPSRRRRFRSMRKREGNGERNGCGLFFLHAAPCVVRRWPSRAQRSPRRSGRGEMAERSGIFFSYFDFIIIILKMNWRNFFFSNILLSHANLSGVIYK